MNFIRRAFQRIDYRTPEKEILAWLVFGGVIYWFGVWGDRYFLPVILPLHGSWLDIATVLLTEWFMYGFLGLFALVTAWRVWKSEDHHSQLVPALFSVVTALILAYIFKSVFAVPRPFVEYSLDALVPAISYAFPSGHTAVAFALLIPFWRISRWLGLAWCAFALAVGFSRVYELVHYPSDIAGGIFLGGAIGLIYSQPEAQKLLSLLWKELEFRRQSFHFMAGFLVVFLHWAGFLRLRFIALALVLGLIISIVSQYRKLPIISEIFHLFDRPRDKDFPGRGAFYYFLGVFLTLLIFSQEHINIAYAAILILAVGDSLNHLIAAPLKIGKVPWNRRKNVLGVTLGILAGTLAALWFVPWQAAFVASTVALLVETVPWRIGKYYLDDNILVPLVAGGIIWWLV